METALTNLCKEVFAETGSVSKLKRLTGGANATTWSFNYNNTSLILRQKAPRTSESDAIPSNESISLSTEAKLISEAARHGVKAPQIHAVTDATSALGEAILMSHVAGEALPPRLFKDPDYDTALSGLTIECADTLAKIHAIPYDNFTDVLEIRTAKQILESLTAQYVSFGQSSPVLASALRWMNDNYPEPTSPVLLHGDFRMGNLLIDKKGLAAVLDWEISFIGDPLWDIAFFCAPPWRFGRYEQSAGGIGRIEDLISAYESASGRTLDAKRILWWRMQASVNWCLICMFMSNLWRSGNDRELERIVIGTRVSESEIDILLLFDEIYGFKDRLDVSRLDLPEVIYKAETRPEELATAISEWLTDDIIPSASGREGFKARVVRNAIGILNRSSRLGPNFTTAQTERLSKLGVNGPDLSQQILNGKFDIQEDEVRLHLKKTTLEKIAIDQPKYAGFKVALTNWS